MTKVVVKEFFFFDKKHSHKVLDRHYNEYDVIVTYLDDDQKEFNQDTWPLFQHGIITNMFSKGLCKIRFLIYSL